MRPAGLPDKARIKDQNRALNPQSPVLFWVKTGSHKKTRHIEKTAIIAYNYYKFTIVLQIGEEQA